MSANLYESLTPKVEEGTPNLMLDSAYLQVLREAKEMSYKQYEVQWIANTIGSYQNEKFNQVVEWINEVDKFLKEVNQENTDTTLRANPIWCNSMLSRIKEVRAKHGPNLTFQRVMGSSSSIEEQLYCEITSLIMIHYGQKWIELNLPNEASEYLQERINETDPFLAEIKLQLEQRIPVTMNFVWYNNKIAETRWLIDKYEPAFYLQSQDVAGSSSMALLSLHEELRCEKRSLISLKCVDWMVASDIATDRDLKDAFSEELQQGINEVNKLLMAIHQELQGKFLAKNFDWYREKIAEARKLIAKNYPPLSFQSQDVEDDAGQIKEQYLASSLQHLQLEEGTSISTTEHNPKPSPLFLQAVSEFGELVLKQTGERRVADILGIYQRRYQKEKYYETMEWIDEVDKFIGESSQEMSDKSRETDSDWCKDVIARTRKLHAKHEPDVKSSSTNMEPLPLHEELCCELKLLIKVNFIQSVYSDHLLALILEVNEFLAEIKKQLEEKLPETNSNWCFNKIAETKALIAKWEPSFSLQSQDARSSSTTLLSLHEELRCEIRSLISAKSADFLVANGTPNDHYLDKYRKELEERINEVSKFLIEINLQLQEKIPEKNSDWYHKKIAETKMLNAKRYSAVPLLSQDVVYTKDQRQIFLSFRGTDTRLGFTNNLYKALRKERFTVFMDDYDLELGDSIAQILDEKIENSKLSIIIFSQNFAESKWCLNEVVKILDCHKKNKQIVWPIFYKVAIDDVKHQKSSYKVAMSKQEKEFGSEKVEKWQSSLSQVCHFKALEYSEKDGYEDEFINKIIKAAKNIRDSL